MAEHFLKITPGATSNEITQMSAISNTVFADSMPGKIGKAVLASTDVQNSLSTDDFPSTLDTHFKAHDLLTLTNFGCKEHNVGLNVYKEENGKFTVVLCNRGFGSKDGMFLEKTLDSIENQTVLPLEVVIGHSECTIEECNKLQDEFRYSFDVVFSPTTKQCFAAENRNRASTIAKGDYISFMDADDQMFTQRLEIILQIINEYNPISIAHGFSKCKKFFSKRFNNPDPNLLMFGEELYKLAKDTEHKHLWIHGEIHHGHLTIKTETIKSIKYNESFEYRRGQDSKFIRDLLNYFPVDKTTLIFIDLPLSYYIPAK